MSLAFFALSSLDLLGSTSVLKPEERTEYIEWIYDQQVLPSGGFRGGPFLGLAVRCVCQEWPCRTFAERVSPWLCSTLGEESRAATPCHELYGPAQPGHPRRRSLAPGPQGVATLRAELSNARWKVRLPL